MLLTRRKSVRFAEDPEGGGASSDQGGKEPPREAVDLEDSGRRKSRGEGARACEGLTSFGAATGSLPGLPAYGSFGNGATPAGERPASTGDNLGGGKEEQAMPSATPLRKWDSRNEESKDDRRGGTQAGALLLNSDEDSPPETGSSSGWRSRISSWYHDF